jgi:hypothetical protein
MVARFGDMGFEGPEAYLRAQGFVLSQRWEWCKPGITRLAQLTEDEWDTLYFLSDEWDYGGLRGQ